MSAERIDVTLSPAEVSEMIVSKFGRALVASREVVGQRERVESVHAAMQTLSDDITAAITYRNQSLGRAIADNERLSAMVEDLTQRLRALTNAAERLTRDSL